MFIKEILSEGGEIFYLYSVERICFLAKFGSFLFLYFWCQTSTVSPKALDPDLDPVWFSGCRTPKERLASKVWKQKRRLFKLYHNKYSFNRIFVRGSRFEVCPTFGLCDIEMWFNNFAYAVSCIYILIATRQA